LAHAFCALWNVGEFGSRLSGLIVCGDDPGAGGSGKSVTPCERMQAAYSLAEVDVPVLGAVVVVDDGTEVDAGGGVVLVDGTVLDVADLDVVVVVEVLDAASRVLEQAAARRARPISAMTDGPVRRRCWRHR
jgi:hypothetical protein